MNEETMQTLNKIRPSLSGCTANTTLSCIRSRRCIMS